MRVKVVKRRTPVRRQERYQVVVFGNNGERVLSGEKLVRLDHALDIAERLHQGDVDVLDLTDLGVS